MGITKSPLYIVVFLLLANFHQILTYAKDFFMEKIYPNSPDLESLFFQIAKFLW